MGVASGISMSLFGLSPLFIAIIARSLFTDSNTGLNVTRFFAFMAILTGTVHLLSALVFPSPWIDVKPVVVAGDTEASEPAGHQEDAVDDNALEEDPLLAPNKPIVDLHVVTVPEPQVGSVLDLLKDPYFWVLAVSVSVVLGSVCSIASKSITPPLISFHRSRWFLRIWVL